jgi:hypothetical protein
MTTGPYDPDEECAVVEEAVSSKDELSSQEEMIKIMSDIKASKDMNANSNSEEGQKGTSSSIRRRASIVGGAAKKVSQSRENGIRTETKQAAPPAMNNLFGELKLKAKAMETSSKTQVSVSDKKMTGLFGDLQNAAKNRQARRSSIL